MHINIALKHAHEHEVCPPRVKIYFHPDLDGLGFSCAGVSSVGGYKRNIWCNLSCLLKRTGI